MKKMLITFAVIIFLVCFVLAIYYGVINAKEIVITKNAWGTAETTEKFNFGKFLIDFLKYNAIGLFGGGILIELSTRHY